MERTELLVLAPLLLLAAAEARAEIVDCPPAQNSYTVYLSEPRYGNGVFATKEQVRAFLDRLQFELDQDREGQWIRLPTSAVHFVVCASRAPALDGNEFDSRLIDTMHTGRVLLEIWGWLDAERQGGGKPRATAQMNYLLVPARYASDHQEAVVPSLQRLRYPEQGAPPTDDYVQLIGRPLDVDAFVAAAFGLKLLRDRQWEVAFGNLCRANTLLARIQRRDLKGEAKQQIAELREFMVASARQAISGAVADGKYPLGGSLRYQDPQHPCAGRD